MDGRNSSGKTLNILGAGFNLGQPLPGVQQGPSSLLEQKLVGRIETLGWHVREVLELEFEATEGQGLPAIPGLPPIHYVREAGYACQQIAEHTAKMLPEADFTLIIGGDHSISVGSISGVAQSCLDNLRVIWVDAHADFNTPTSSESHNLHGMPLSALTDMFDLSRYPNFEFLTRYPRLKPSHVALIGVRSIDLPELALLEESGIHLYTMSEIDRYGIDAVLRDAEEQLKKDDKGGKLEHCHFHLSFDIDAMDPSIAPNTGTCVPGGLTYREAHYIAEYLHQTGSLKSMDLVEVNPILGRPDCGSTLNMAIELVESALGKRIAAPRRLISKK